MKHYKDKNNQIFAFEDDGSQDDLIREDMVEITNEEADSIRYPSISQREASIAKGKIEALEMQSLRSIREAILSGDKSQLLAIDEEIIIERKKINKAIKNDS